MKVPIKLLKDEVFRLKQILANPMNVLEEFSNPEMVSWKSFEDKKTQLETELNDVHTALSQIDPDFKVE
ncbi:hypothetical protein [Flavobacterium sp. FlaQc-50]|uniref:hypothetical protein n=1 Tax=unclassified Flavobacterium TaxID=196869 RepID=UPI0037572ECF